MKKTKGIILAGGAGTRMYPMTSLYSKQLIAVYDKPMIYYPLSTLILAGIKEVLIISNDETIPHYQKLFKNGSHLGMKIEYAVQKAPKGIAEAFIIGEKFIGKDNAFLILGDNIFYGYLNFLRDAVNNNKTATVFGYYVKDPERYGVVEFDKSGKAISIEEKPKKPKSNYAVPGIYIFDNSCVQRAKKLKPSARGEVEITDLIKTYLEEENLNVVKIGRGIAWLDSGTPDSLLDASSFIASIEQRQGLKIGCIEEAAYAMKFIKKAGLNKIIEEMPNSYYRVYLEGIYNIV
ncbi:MAG: glucose-1-phosphate thymidylyltransferase RfbA [Candidatus Delongbacteria bacterium]|nr:glucose-1-phosphate thymidylyltransferase RfbA [Candidatus Delongbacteria bacterium]MCG2760658.1 glucose-1-phosphate thymidylyltransferase RfbA [Candidatus Delongbacteria bacterium]